MFKNILFPVALAMVLGLGLSGCKAAPPKAMTYQLDIETPLGPVAVRLNSKAVPTAKIKK